MSILVPEIVKLTKSDTDDLLDGRFVINLSQEVPELSNEFVKYFQCTSNSDGANYFAMVYENTFAAQLELIDFLQKNPLAGLSRVHAYGVVKLSAINSERLVVVVGAYNYESTLLAYVQKNDPLTKSDVEKLAATFCGFSEKLAAKCFFGYNICPENIIITEDRQFLFREFFNNYPYFSTGGEYIAAELVECTKAALRVCNIKQDVYALGISVFFGYTGKAPWSDYSDIAIYNQQRLEHGSYKYLVSKLKTTERMRAFFYGTLEDDALTRWGNLNLLGWLEKKPTENFYNSIVEHKYTISFNDLTYSNMKSLSYAIFRNWGSAGKFIRDSKLLKWVINQNASNEVIDGIKQIVDIRGHDGNIMIASPGTTDQKITKLLSYLDKNGSIRYESLAITPYSIPELVQYLYVAKKKHLLEQVIKIMKEEIWKLYNEEFSAGYLDDITAGKFQYFASQTSMHHSSFKTVERLIYLLNPSSVCLSPILKNRYVTNISELLIALDEYSLKLQSNFNADKHILAFLAVKLDLKNPITVSVLQDFPGFADHFSMQSLAVVNSLQTVEPGILAPNLCRVIAADLVELFEDTLHNVQFKKTVTSKILEAAKTGKAHDIIAVLSDSQGFVNDYQGYHDALQKTEMLKRSIVGLRDDTGVINNNAVIIGQKTTVLFSYILCFIVTIALMF